MAPSSLHGEFRSLDPEFLERVLRVAIEIVGYPRCVPSEDGNGEQKVVIPDMDDQITGALQGREVVVDITTIGRRTGNPRRMEIWFHNIDGRIIITGTPGPRSWLANMTANPDFTLHLKGTVQADLPARARLITDPEERRDVMSAPETRWYRDQVGGVEPLVAGSPIVEVVFTENQ